MDEIVIYSKEKKSTVRQEAGKRMDRKKGKRKGNEWEIRMNCWAV